ncbi:type IV pili methyl-accepting chemotaxis transducer N-terminal domain-containing protein [uncultured Arcticibacterium sp.]|uniref:type IV pili methyl-accepting chemotaxis transducer N-terminal domain-containing protein n=1 Tax=uncultured Arcticibacterium sp. TaxID=2173042 RepID=UPI0030F8E77F
MKRKYIFGVLLTVGLIFINQMLIQYALATIKQDAKHINISGRQRMLSQRLNLQFYQLSQNSIEFKTLKETFDLAKTSHLALIHGSKELSLNGIKSPEIVKMLEKLNERYTFTGNIISNFQQSSELNLESINQNQQLLLEEMDAIVNALEMKSQEKISGIVLLEIILALFSIIIIALEVRYIYYPQANSLEKSRNQVLEQNKALKQIAWQQSHEVRKPVANILAISQLIKTDPTLIDSEKNQLLNHLEESTHDLDKIIKSIVDKAYEIQQENVGNR